MAADDTFEPGSPDGGGRRHRNSDRASAASLRHSLSRSLAQRDESGLISPARIHPDLQNITDLRGGQRMLDRIHVFDCLSAHLEKNISEQHSGLFRGSTVFDVHDQQPDSRLSRQLRAHIFWHLHRLHRNTQIRPSDMPSFQEFFDDAIDGCHRHRHGSSMAESPRIDANNFAPGIEQRSAGKSRIEGEVEPDVLIELSPTPVPPLAADAADDPTARH